MITFARFPAGDPVPEPGNGNAVSALVAEAFADVDEARSRELNRLLKTRYANTDPRQIPPEVLHQPQEDVMVTKCDQGCGRKVRAREGVVNPTCKRCRAKAGKGETVSVPAVENPARKAQAKRSPHLDLEGFSVTDLVELQASIADELRIRRDKMAVDLNALNRALGQDHPA